MIVNTSRFGEVEVEDGRVITFTKGLLGFPQYKRYVLIQPSDDSYFFWLQSLEMAELAFVVTDPTLFVADYTVPVKNEQLQELGIDHLDDAQVLVIVNKRGDLMTGNLQGPLVIHAVKRVGEQMVLADRRFDTRVPLMDLSQGAKAVSA